MGTCNDPHPQMTTQSELNLSGGTCAGSRKACRKTSATHTESETQADYTAQTGTDLKEKGIKKVASHNEKWMEQAIIDYWYFKMVRSPREFTGEDIRHSVASSIGEPSHPNAWGALIATLVRRKIIKPVGYQKAKNAAAHARVIRVYQAY